jgi:hypothetical protein
MASTIEGIMTKPDTGDDRQGGARGGRVGSGGLASPLVVPKGRSAPSLGKPRHARRTEALEKPLRAVLLTHPHPYDYGGPHRRLVNAKASPSGVVIATYRSGADER